MKKFILALFVLALVINGSWAADLNYSSQSPIYTERGLTSVTGGSATLVLGTNQVHPYEGLTSIFDTGYVAFEEGVVTALAGATFASLAGGTQTEISGVIHNLNSGDIIALVGNSTAGYNAIGTVVGVTDTSTFAVDIAFVDDPITEGSVRRGDSYILTAAGNFFVDFIGSGSSSAAAQTFTVSIYKNTTLLKKVESDHVLTDKQILAIKGGAAFAANDVIWLAITNQDSAEDLTIQEGEFSIY